MKKNIGLILEGLNSKKAGDSAGFDWKKVKVGTELKVTKDIDYGGIDGWDNSALKAFKALGMIEGENVIIKKGLSIKVDAVSRSGFDATVTDGKKKTDIEFGTLDDSDNSIADSLEVVKY